MSSNILEMPVRDRSFAQAFDGFAAERIDTVLMDKRQSENKKRVGYLKQSRELRKKLLDGLSPEQVRIFKEIEDLRSYADSCDVLTTYKAGFNDGLRLRLE